MKRLQSPTDPTPSKQEWMQRFIQDLGVLTGGQQNDMFFCRNPSSPTARADVSPVMDVESLSDSESAHISQTKSSELHDSHARNAQAVEAHARESLEVPERGRKLSSSRKESVDKIYKSLKKKVSFDKGQSYNPLEEGKEEANNERPSAPRQKRSLPRQEIAIDLESPISNKRLSDIYPVIVSEGQSGVDGQSGQSQEKKRKIGKYRNITRENVGLDSSQSNEMSSSGGVSQESGDQSNDNACPNADSTQTKGSMVLPNLVVKATVTETSDASVSGSNNEVMTSKANSGAGLLDPSQGVNKTIPEKLDPGASDGNGGIPDSSIMNCEDVVDEDESSKSLNENSGSRKFVPKNDESKRWLRSGLDDSKETSL